MPEKPWFEEWYSSPYYHLLHKHRDGEEALDFIKAVIQYLKPLPNSKVLEVGCGTGKHCKALAELGFDVTGIDLSFEITEVASSNATDNLRFFQHDIRLPFWINYFDYAFNFFTSFGYFRTRREHENGIRTIAQSLKPEGIVVVDYLNVHYTEDHLKTKSSEEIDGVKFRLSRWHDDDHFYKQIQIEGKGIHQKHLFTEKIAKFSLGDFNDMFAYHGIQIQEVFGDYKFGHYDVRKSPRMIMIAKKIRVDV